MTETVIVAVLSLAGTLIGTYLANRKSAYSHADHRRAWDNEE